MSNTIEAHCSACDENTSFLFDGDSWECDSCGSNNTQGNHYDSENPFGSD